MVQRMHHCACRGDNLFWLFLLNIVIIGMALNVGDSSTIESCCWLIMCPMDRCHVFSHDMRSLPHGIINHMNQYNQQEKQQDFVQFGHLQNQKKNKTKKKKMMTPFCLVVLGSGGLPNREIKIVKNQCSKTKRLVVVVLVVLRVDSLTNDSWLQSHEVA